MRNACSSLQISRLAFTDIEKAIARKSAIIVPIAGLEPFGNRGGIGSAGLCAWHLADALSARTDTLLAPLLPYGGSYGFAAFGGISAVKRDSLARVLCELGKCWVGQGIKHLAIVDGQTSNAEFIDETAAQLKKRNPAVTLQRLSWQSMKSVRQLVDGSAPGPEIDRKEFALMSMTGYLDPAYLKHSADLPPEPRRPDAGAYQRWMKLGRDPQKLRKLLPDGTMLPAGVVLDIALGEKLFAAIVDILVNEFTKARSNA
jgi:creatinine amidohydrolase/Fe(II)-dependent formamide hydrolase-like protein